VAPAPPPSLGPPYSSAPLRHWTEQLPLFALLHTYHAYAALYDKKNVNRNSLLLLQFVGSCIFVKWQTRRACLVCQVSQMAAKDNLFSRESKMWGLFGGFPSQAEKKRKNCFKIWMLSWAISQCLRIIKARPLSNGLVAHLIYSFSNSSFAHFSI